MSVRNIIRAWKDPEYRLSLSEAELAVLPDNPAGLIELTAAELDNVAGARPSQHTDCKETCNWDCPC